MQLVQRFDRIQRAFSTIDWQDYSLTEEQQATLNGIRRDIIDYCQNPIKNESDKNTISNTLISFFKEAKCDTPEIFVTNEFNTVEQALAPKGRAS